LTNFATKADVEALWRSLRTDEESRCEQLLTVVSNRLRLEAEKRGKDLDEMVAESLVTKSVAKSVTVDIVARTLMTETDTTPMTQFSESGMGYTVSGTFLSPGGGIFIKDDELAALGIKRQRIGVISLC